LFKRINWVLPGVISLLNDVALSKTRGEEEIRKNFFEGKKKAGWAGYFRKI
jgi:hypothetical protein